MKTEGFCAKQDTLIGAIFIGICIILAAALLAHAITFMEVMSIVICMLFWIAIILIIAMLAILILIIVIVVKG